MNISDFVGFFQHCLDAILLPWVLWVAQRNDALISFVFPSSFWVFPFLACRVSLPFYPPNLLYLCCDLFNYVLVLSVLVLASVSRDQMKPREFVASKQENGFCHGDTPCKDLSQNSQTRQHLQPVSNLWKDYGDSSEFHEHRAWLTSGSKHYMFNTKQRAFRNRNTRDVIPSFIIVNIQSPNYQAHGGIFEARSCTLCVPSSSRQLWYHTCRSQQINQTT